MTLKDILRAKKGSDIHTIHPTATCDDVVGELVRQNIGSLIVCPCAYGGMMPRVVGIITERDILRAQAAHRAPLERLCVADVMTTELVTASPDDTVERAMELMTQRRVRHLPIIA